MGIIDALTSGFDVINRRLWIIAIPLLTDLGIWLGLQVKAGPLAELVSSLVAWQGAQQAAGWLRDANLAVILTLYLPTLSSIGGELGASRLQPMLVLAPHGILEISISLVTLLILGLVIGTFYLAAVAQSVRGEVFRFPLTVRRVPFLALRLTALSFVYGAVVTVTGILGFVIGFLLAPVSTVLASVLVTVVQAGMLWALFVLYFSSSALFCGGLGPWEAVIRSYQIVRGSFWSALGFVAVVTVISMGIPLALNYLTGTALGTAVSIVGNAYIGTGLVAATMVYYREKSKTLNVTAVGAWRRSDRS